MLLYTFPPLPVLLKRILNRTLKELFIYLFNNIFSLVEKIVYSKRKIRALTCLGCTKCSMKKVITL